jgi:uncharacterized repeat protein (TIGR01451 family)
MGIFMSGAANITANARLARLIAFGLATGFATPVYAAGTVAGTTITNTATATYTDPSGNPVNVPSNTVNLRVDEVLNVTVATAEAGDVAAQPGAINQVVKYTVTNTGNGSEAFRLLPVTAIGGDAFDPTATSIVLDTNGNGVYDAGVDTVYTSGGNDPVLAPDTSIKVFILSTVPAAATDGQRGQIDLSATAVTGSGPAGTLFAGQGTGGGDAVVGTTTGVGSDKNFYVVSAATVALAKSAAVLDPFGGTKSIPGAVITYTLVATVSGSGTLANLAIGDPIPGSTTYVPASITAESATVTDATDGDSGEFAADRVSVRFGSVAGGQVRTVTFKVRIN